MILIQFVLETSRQSPFPFPIWKTCTEDIRLTDFDGRSLLVEKGVEIILPINALHNHPDYYKDPEKFDPERFEASNSDVKTLKNAGVFMPFGNGPRSCLGNFLDFNRLEYLIKSQFLFDFD